MRAMVGVISFDVGRDLTDPSTFIGTEVYEDPGARERLESLPEAGRVVAILREALAAPPEATLYHVSSSEPTT